MDLTHSLVGGLIAGTAAFLLWLELHSRRQAKRSQSSDHDQTKTG